MAYRDMPSKEEREKRIAKGYKKDKKKFHGTRTESIARDYKDTDAKNIETRVNYEDSAFGFSRGKKK